LDTFYGTPLSILLLDLSGIINPDFVLTVSFFMEVFSMLVLLLVSGFISGAETAFFSLTPAQILELKESKSGREKTIYLLLSKPKRLLATLLISINFINIAIVILSSLLTMQIFDVTGNETLGFVIQVGVVTFVIVLFCEVMPKVYANQNALRFASATVMPLFVIDKIMRPVSWLLVSSTSMIDRYVGKKGYNISVDELSHAIDITSNKDTPEEEKKILKGIARFGDIDVRQIMKPRMDVIAFDLEDKFEDIIPVIVENRYSRIPVYNNSFDSVTGVLYIKDLLPYLDSQPAEFKWQNLLRPAYFVPESKKINDLLQEFQEKKMHLAIVVDEYGGSSGIVTLEDILEEIVGEINDEFDEDEMFYSKLDDNNFVFEGKTLLNDVCRVMEVDRKEFEIENDGVETLAGLILEIKGSIPQKNEALKLNGMVFTIESADKRRIKRVKITRINEQKEETEEHGFQDGLHLWLVLVLSGAMLSMLFTGCDDTYTPKPRGYFRINLPVKHYSLYDPKGCPFSFEIPSYATVTADSSPNAEPCWMNLDFPEFKGTVYLSYKEVDNNVAKFIEDSRTLSMKHIPRASGIQEIPVAFPDRKVYGTYYSIKGSAASPVQFFLTDSTKHFLRGSLYFYAPPQPDSIAPVLDFVTVDIDHLVETLRWK
jgi:putative hemolysin